MSQVPLTPNEIHKQHERAIAVLSIKKEPPVFDDPFDKDRPRTGARWLDDEMVDLKLMVEREYNLNRISTLLRRSESATLKRIMTHKLSTMAVKYMPEAKKYLDDVHRFSGRCYFHRRGK